MPEPDRSFMKDLKNLDKRLGVKFNDRVGNFVVTYDRPQGDAVNIYRVRSDDGSFRQPDKRDLMIIKGGDLAEGERMENRLKKLAYTSELIRRKDRQKAHDLIRDRTKDDRLQLKRAFIQATNQSKGNAEFRRIPHKPGKNVVKVVS